MSLRALARRAGTSHATLSAYESGRVDPGCGVAGRIVTAAGWRSETVLVARPCGPGGRERGDELFAVLELAAEFPARHSCTLEAPVFPRR